MPPVTEIGNQLKCMSLPFLFKKDVLCCSKVEPCKPDKTLEISEELNTTDYIVPINAYYIMMEFI